MGAKALILASLCVLNCDAAEKTVQLFPKGILSDPQTLATSDHGVDGITVDTSILHGGKQEGTLLVKITNSKMSILVSPSRGMNIINATDVSDPTVRIGWDNPIQEVVNPIYLNQMMRGGNGFLDAFSESVVRCGFEWVGHAGIDGDELLTLHGLNAATPASIVEVVGNDQAKTVILRGVMYQTATKKVSFKITTELTIAVDQWGYTIDDTLTNFADYEHEYMSLYHSNVGTPILGEGTKIEIAAQEVSPFNPAAQDELDTWDTFKGPTKNYDETVYNIYPYADDKNIAVAMLVNKDRSKAVTVTWDVTTLPVFGLWKNTDTIKQAYVAGLEPGTSFSYNRVFNRDLGLVPKIPAQSDVKMHLEYALLTAKADIDSVSSKIKKIQNARDISLRQDPLSLEGKGSSGSASLIRLSIILLLLLFI